MTATPTTPDPREALRELVRYVERNTCLHEETHRAGFIWTICDGCGRKWADDEGGFQPDDEPAELVAARAALATPAARQGGERRAEVFKEAMHSWHDAARVEYERAEQLAATLENDTAYARRLATALHRAHYAAEAPQWEPFDDLNGLLSQIDNMVTGLMRKPEEAALSARPAAGDGEWLPMDEAPRDGTIIVCRYEHHPVRPAMFDGEAWVTWGAITESGPEPTGWRPLAACEPQVQGGQRHAL